MKKYLLISVAAFSISFSGCIDTSKHNQSQDDIWIQQQIEKGETLPDVLSN